MRLLQKANSNSLFGRSLFIFLIRFFPALASVLATIYYARQLDVSVNGKYVSFWLQLPLMAAIAGAGINAFMLTYTPGVIVGLFRRLKRQYFVLYGLWVLAAAFLFAAMQVHSGISGFTLSFFFLVAYVCSTILESFLIACRNVRSVAFVNIVYAVSFVALHWYAMQVGMSFPFLFTGLLIICLLRLLFYIITTVISARKIPGEVHEAISLDDSRSLWLHMMFYDVSQVAFKWIDKIFISLFLAAALSAIYFNGANDIPFLPIILSAVGSAVLIDLAANNNDDKYTVALMQYSAKVLSAIVFPVFFFLLFFRYEIFSVVFTHKYEDSVPIFLAAVFVVPLRAYNFTTVLQNRHKGRIINTGAIADLFVACALMYPLYLLMGLPGIALAFTISTYLQAGYYLYHTAKVLKVSVRDIVPYRNWLIKLIVFFLFFIVFHYALSMYFSDKNVLILACILTAIVALAALRLELQKHSTDGNASQDKAK